MNRDPYSDDAPEVEPPTTYVRCAACLEIVELDWLVEHVKEECDGQPLYEDLEPIGLSSADDPAPEEADLSDEGSAASEGAGGQAKAISTVAEEPAPAPSSIHRKE
jgi:hypothetical protein